MNIGGFSYHRNYGPGFVFQPAWMKPLWQSGLLECEGCGTNDDVERTTDPFDVEIRDDFTLHDLCQDCWTRSAYEI